MRLDEPTRFLPLSLQRHLRAVVVGRRLRRIARVARGADRLFVRPERNVDHYYHFLFDLVLPLFCVAADSPRGARFVVERFGPLSDRLDTLLPGRTELVEGGHDEKEPAIDLPGLNSRYTRLEPKAIDAFSRHTAAALGVTLCDEPRDVVLVERMPPAEYYLTDSARKGGGSHRRAILNHAELAGAIADSVPAPLVFRNARLEELSAAEQYRLFADAAIVIGQHGAGLANCLWCRPGTLLLELNSTPERIHFRQLAKTRAMRYSQYTLSTTRAEVDADHFARWFAVQMKAR
ncbi:MAG: glycosyltransferase family 61 protein [Planctomycetota bacterium]